MKRFLSLMVGGCALAALSTTALAGDGGPPNFPGFSWDRSDPGTTWQLWTFGQPGTTNGLIFPDATNNPFGMPQVNPSQSVATPGTIEDADGRPDSVWCIPPTGALFVTVPNMLDFTKQKDIFIQYKWWTPIGILPEPQFMALDPGGLMASPGPVVCTPTTVATTATDILRSSCTSLQFPYCPQFEVIKITNPHPNVPLYLTQLVIDTRCIPTPGAGALLAAAGLIAARRKR